MLETSIRNAYRPEFDATEQRSANTYLGNSEPKIYLRVIPCAKWHRRFEMIIRYGLILVTAASIGFATIPAQAEDVGVGVGPAGVTVHDRDRDRDHDKTTIIKKDRDGDRDTTVIKKHDT